MKFVKSAMVSFMVSLLKTSSLASAFLASSLAIGLSAPLATMAQADIIQERKANFKQSAGALRAMRTQMSQGDYAAIAKSANAIAAWAEKMPSYFPKDSQAGNTNARPEIWQKFDQFTALANAHYKAALTLSAAAKQEDPMAVQNAMQNLGQTCGACHSQFKK